MEKGDKRFNSPKSSKVKKVFSLLNKTVRLNFSSYKCKLLKFSLTALLSNENTFLTFELLGLLKRLSPFSTEPFNYPQDTIIFCGSYLAISVLLPPKIYLMDLPNYGVCVRQWKPLYTRIALSHSVQFLFLQDILAFTAWLCCLALTRGK